MSGRPWDINTVLAGAEGYIDLRPDATNENRAEAASQFAGALFLNEEEHYTISPSDFSNPNAVLRLLKTIHDFVLPLQETLLENANISAVEQERSLGGLAKFLGEETLLKLDNTLKYGTLDEALLGVLVLVGSSNVTNNPRDDAIRVRITHCLFEYSTYAFFREAHAQFLAPIKTRLENNSLSPNEQEALNELLHDSTRALANAMVMLSVSTSSARMLFEMTKRQLVEMTHRTINVAQSKGEMRLEKFLKGLLTVALALSVVGISLFASKRIREATLFTETKKTKPHALFTSKEQAQMTALDVEQEPKLTVSPRAQRSPSGR